ncbi:MAG: aldolase/citrate lyase family protein [Spirochaetia bacterium]|nr:aldolase/citrate lyase family protein [Spirochaetia bacterium]
MNIDVYKKKREDLLQQISTYKTHLSILDQVQETHYIVPADNQPLIEKALNRGCSQSLELLARYDISLGELADTLECDDGVITSIVESNYHADLILIDGEDATSLDEESILTARKNIIFNFNERKNFTSRVYFRPSGLELKYCIDDIVSAFSGVLFEKGKRYPIDGMVYPKVENSNEINFICQILDDAEIKIGLPVNSIKIQFLVESALAVESLYEIAHSCKHRLGGIIFGMADYAAETGISILDENHPLFQYARMRIINVSSALGVPSIDCMSFKYPVADKNLGKIDNKKLILRKMRDVLDITLNSVQLGMKGKWVGHPLQLLAAKIAYEKHYSQQRLDQYIEKLKIYADSNSGANIIHNDMADRATDRNVRSFLRRAVLKKKIDIILALNLNLIDENEYKLLKDLS